MAASRTRRAVIWILAVGYVLGAVLMLATGAAEVVFLLVPHALLAGGWLLAWALAGLVRDWSLQLLVVLVALTGVVLWAAAAFALLVLVACGERGCSS